MSLPRACCSHAFTGFAGTLLCWWLLLLLLPLLPLLLLLPSLNQHCIRIGLGTAAVGNIMAITDTLYQCFALTNDFRNDGGFLCATTSLLPTWRWQRLLIHAHENTAAPLHHLLVPGAC
jgi:hypothetical protein